MTKLQDLPEVTTVIDGDFLLLYSPLAVAKDGKMKTENLRAPAKVETLTNKTLNTPATAKPAFVTTLQLVGAKLTNALRGSGNLAPGVLAADTETTVTLTVTGLAVGDHVVLNPTAALEAGIILAFWWVSATDTLSVRVRNCAPAAATTGTAIPVSILAFRSVAPDA